MCGRGMDKALTSRCVMIASRRAAWLLVACFAGPVLAATPVAELPVIKEMPDPLVMRDGTRVSTPEQWRARRGEMIQILEDYEYGHMPPPPGNTEPSRGTCVTVPRLPCRIEPRLVSATDSIAVSGQEG